jgi:hypothetical protein
MIAATEEQSGERVGASEALEFGTLKNQTGPPAHRNNVKELSFPINFLPCSNPRIELKSATGTRSVQLQRSGYRKHGSLNAFRCRGTPAAMAAATAGRHDPLGVRRDRTGGGELGCHRGLITGQTLVIDGGAIL